MPIRPFHVLVCCRATFAYPAEPTAREALTKALGYTQSESDRASITVHFEQVQRGDHPSDQPRRPTSAVVIAAGRTAGGGMDWRTVCTAALSVFVQGGCMIHPKSKSGEAASAYVPLVALGDDWVAPTVDS